jgi:hypothetical protein
MCYQAITRTFALPFSLFSRLVLVIIPLTVISLAKFATLLMFKVLLESSENGDSLEFIV